MTASTAALDIAADVLRRRIGLRVEASLYVRLAHAIADAAQWAGEDPETFVAGLADDSHALQALYDRVTVQESGFFRHPEQFDVLVSQLLPGITGPVRIWSAGCGNGQEPYSLAMVLAEQRIDGRVIATDVSTAAVRRTQQGSYSERELAGLSSWRQRSHGMSSGDAWTVATALRSRVEATAHNLLDPLPRDIGLCQIVFCRNVLIYFTAEHAAAFVDRLADALPPDAHLFLGGTETMLYVSDRFEPRQFGDAFVYRLRRSAPAMTVQHSSPASVSTRKPRRTLRERERRITSAVARHSRPESRRQPPEPTRAGPDTVASLAGLGREAHANGDHVAAVRAFRKWAYLSPDDPVAHFHLGLALEAGGHRAAASRSYATTRTLLLRGDVTESVAAFGGYGMEDILRMISAKEAAAE